MGSKKDTATTTTEPWDASQPYVLDTMRQAQNLYNYGPSTVAPFSSDQLNAFNQMRNLANQPVNSNVEAASGVIGDALSGGMIGQNPYATAQNPYIGMNDLSGVTDYITNAAQRAVGDQFTAAGRSGSPAEQMTLGKTIARELSPYAFGAQESALNRSFQGAENQINRGYNDYATGVQNQLRAAQFAPQLAAQEQQLGLFGPQLQEYIGQQYQNLDSQYRNEPYSLLSNFYSPIVNGIAGLGGTSTQTQPGGSLLGGALGGAASGFALGNSIAPGIGGLIGGGLGAIGGIF